MRRKLDYIVGIDEVGRGPLAGPLILAAVAIPKGTQTHFFEGIRDSKKLTALAREVWAKKIFAIPDSRISFALIQPRSIDRYGMSRVVRLAVARALQKLRIEPRECEVFLDGSLCAPSEYERQSTIIRGDESVPVIAAASIVAKVRRDRLLVRLHKKYPAYGFNEHKGYGTKAHMDAIKQNGLSEIHRKTFCARLV